LTATERFVKNRLPAELETLAGEDAVRQYLTLAVAGWLVVPASALPAQTPPIVWDAHVHLSAWGASALDSLASAGVTHVRDCGSDPEEVLRWRDEIRRGVRGGPRIVTAGWVVDGPKDAEFRLTVRSPAEAEAAVDSLERLGVDFIKTHSALSREAYFAVLRAARARRLRVVSHLPRGVPAWEAADSGVSDIEHAAESMVASPLNAGLATTVDEVIAWWRSPAGDSVIRRLAARGVVFTPTLARYAAMVDRPSTAEARAGRRRLLPFLVELTGRFHRAGVPILAGSDFAGPETPLVPGRSLHEELRWLARAGLSPKDVEAAASTNVERWLEGRP
jgi:imidazolonepropionase-like amidohydrolase